MFKYLTRALIAFCLLTPIGALAQDEQTAEEKEARKDLVSFCNDYQDDSPLHENLCTDAVFDCIDDPTGVGCADSLGAIHKVTEIRFCRQSANHTHSGCADTFAAPNAAAWAKHSSVTSSTAETTAAKRGNQILLGLRGGLDTTGLNPQGEGVLNLSTASFGGVALGGAVADGVAFVKSRYRRTHHYYAGLLGDTDLGARLTTDLPTASWVGQIEALNYGEAKDFVLRVNFADKEIEAFAALGTNTATNVAGNHIYISGNFADSGMILNGKTHIGLFTGNDRARPVVVEENGSLSGLIGSEGAIGAFIGVGYSGGFVAVAPNAAHTAALGVLCTDDPFHPSCYDNIAAQAVFCHRAENKGNPSCMNAQVVSNICDYAPFASVCFKDRTEGSPTNYAAKRKTKFTQCRADSSDKSCTGVTQSPNALAWEASFANRGEPLPSKADTVNPRGQFLKATATGISEEGIDVQHSFTRFNLNLGTSTFNGKALGGDIADGVIFFSGFNSNRRYYTYAGIFSGTDLGASIKAPDAQTVKANWVGRFKYFGGKDFVLEVDYTGKQIEAFVPTYYSKYYHLKGSYVSNGVITGTIDWGDFIDGKRTNPTEDRRLGVLTGLIGEEGAVGVFVGSRYHDGGFVARPATTTETEFLRDTCLADPFKDVCYFKDFKNSEGKEVLTDDLRDTRFKKCITDGNANDNALCGSAINKYWCIKYPFGDECVAQLGGDYQTVRENRLDFCNDLNNADTPICSERARVGLCNFDPFNVACFKDGLSYEHVRKEICPLGNEDSEQCNAARVKVCGADGRNDIFNPLCAGDSYETTRTARVTHCDNRANVNDPLCTGLAMAGFCSYENPFHPVCADRTYDSARVKFCDETANASNGLCTGTSARVTTLNLPAQSKVLDTTQKKNQFLKGTSDGLNFGNARNQYGNIPYMHTLTLQNARVVGLTIDEDAADGVAFFYADNFYAGILSGTDLGASVGTRGTAEWKGEIINPSRYYFEDLILEIDFAKKKIESFTQNRKNARYFHILGNFDTASGVITGTTNYASFTDGDRTKPIDNPFYGAGTLTGLIGQEGAVGVFVSNKPGGSGTYGGGFVASPTAGKVSYKDWENGFGASPAISDNPIFAKPISALPYTPRQNQFLQGTPSTIATGDITIDIAGTTPTPVTLNMSEAEFDDFPLGGDEADGIAFFTGKNGRYFYYYAAVMSGTNLGAPVTTDMDDATWEGEFRTIHDKDGRDFTMEIDFAERELEAIVRDRTTSRYFHLDGGFNDAGVITGTVDYGGFSSTDLDNLVATGTRYPGILSGLIGQEGAVGVFISDDTVQGYRTNRGYAGGFVACPAGGCQ